LKKIYTADFIGKKFPLLSVDLIEKKFLKPQTPISTDRLVGSHFVSYLPCVTIFRNFQTLPMEIHLPAAAYPPATVTIFCEFSRPPSTRAWLRSLWTVPYVSDSIFFPVSKTYLSDRILSKTFFACGGLNIEEAKITYLSHSFFL
jgi:hypothetical protein